MPSTDDPEEFRAYWQEHVSELAKLGNTLNDDMDIQSLLSCLDELEHLVDKAAGELEG